jgi:hypothetical protein
MIWSSFHDNDVCYLMHGGGAGDNEMKELQRQLKETTSLVKNLLNDL